MRCFLPIMRNMLLGAGILWVLPLGAQVNRTELEQHQAAVSFINYEGPHARIESRDQIRNIGYVLGDAVRRGNNSPGARSRYFAIHVTEREEEGRLSADVFGLGYDTGVDHIRNLRLILQGYLEGAYLYSAGDAALLAEYVTIYNAVYRGDWDYVDSRYGEAVTSRLSREQAGLSIRFDEWPGQTLLIIPLGSGAAGSLSALDTSVVSDSRVVEELRRDGDRGVEQRQDMVDLKEREAEEAEQRAREQFREADEEQRRIDEERRQIEEERRRIVQAPVREDSPPPEEPEQPAGQEARREAPGREEAPPEKEDPPLTAEESPQTEARREELAGREAELDRRQEEADRRRDEARRDEELAGQKREEAREERESIAADQQALIDGGSPPEEEGLITAILNGPDSPLGRFVRIGPEGKELGRSLINTVNVRTILHSGGRIIAIAGENRGSGAVRLIEIDGGTLGMKAQGEDDIHPQSLLWVNGSDLYAVIVSGEDAYLGRFNSALALEARSRTPLHPLASLWFQDDLVLSQRPDGSALILNAQTLGEQLIFRSSDRPAQGE